MISSRPHFFFFPGFRYFLNCSQGQVELGSKSLRGRQHSQFLSAAPPPPRDTFCSSSVAERQPCVVQAMSCHLRPRGGLQAIVLSVSLSAATLQDSLSQCTEIALGFLTLSPGNASPPTVVLLWMPEAELIRLHV